MGNVIHRELGVRGVGLVAVGLLAAGCSSAFSGDSDCAATRSCDSQGESPTGGTGAQGGKSESVPCETDASCDDAEPCNGVERCPAGRCVSGSAACPASKDTHCSVTCANKAGVAKCTTAAKDADGDAHGDAKCAAAPGDDCDDTSKAVFPGAAETCDGVDQNCNGVKDVAEELILLGSSVLPIKGESNASTEYRGWPITVAPDASGGFLLAGTTKASAVVLEHRAASFEDPGAFERLGVSFQNWLPIKLAYGGATVGHNLMWGAKGSPSADIVTRTIDPSGALGSQLTVQSSMTTELTGWDLTWSPTRDE